MPMIDPAKEKLLDAILPHVPFDGWSDAAFRAAVSDTGMKPEHARTICPRGALDLAVTLHERDDDAMRAALRPVKLEDMRVRDRIATALRTRLEVIGDKEAVRRATALFTLPQHAAEGARLVWGTADAIWDALGDPSDDINWYTKRATLSGVYASSVLYWLGDDSVEHQATGAFIERRIDDVMQVEKVKARVNANPLLRPFLQPANAVLSMVKAPSRTPRMDLPGSWTSPR